MSTPTQIAETTRRGVDDMQLGHIKRLQQIADYPPGEWAGMGKAAHQGDDFSGYRFQLAFGAYALALGHRHRLPNAPVMFKSAFAGLIDKLLRADVWMYWKDVSQGGSLFNAHLGRLPEEWDPVARDNIMYSAYLQSMTTMFNVLFDDDRYTEPGALSIRYSALFWGHGDKNFVYDQNSLTDVLYWQMVENGYLGIACEPNCVFQTCNQPAILGFRMHDQLTGGNIADDVVAGYKKAHAEFGHLGENGHYNMLVLEDSKTLVQNDQKYPWVDGWNGAMMNTWNREFVREHYASQVADLLVQETGGTLSVACQPVSLGPDPDTGEEVTIDIDADDFGWVAAWASEMGDTETLNGLLAHADRYMNPTWTDGALTYKRNDTKYDDDGHYVRIGPMTSNSLLAYARLNVEDGLWGLYNEPWDQTHFSEPLVVGRSDNVDVTTAYFDRDTKQLHLGVLCRGDGPAHIDISNVGDFELDAERGSTSADRHDDVLRIQMLPDATASKMSMTLTVPDWAPAS